MTLNSWFYFLCCWLCLIGNGIQDCAHVGKLFTTELQSCFWDVISTHVLVITLLTYYLALSLLIIDLSTLRDWGSLDFAFRGWPPPPNFLVFLVMTGAGCNLFLKSVPMALLFLQPELFCYNHYGFLSCPPPNYLFLLCVFAHASCMHVLMCMWGSTIVELVLCLPVQPFPERNSGGHACLANAFNLLSHLTGPRNSLESY